MKYTEVQALRKQANWMTSPQAGWQLFASNTVSPAYGQLNRAVDKHRQVLADKQRAWQRIPDKQKSAYPGYKKALDNMLKAKPDEYYQPMQPLQRY